MLKCTKKKKPKSPLSTGEGRKKKKKTGGILTSLLVNVNTLLVLHHFGQNRFRFQYL